MDDYSLDLKLSIGQVSARYRRLHPDMVSRLGAIAHSQDPRIRGRVAALAAAVVRRAQDRQQRLKNRFRLTPAEARVALHLIDGGDIASYALAAGVSPGTVRTQLKSVFAKTGVHRQAELVRIGQELS